jgi:hypothetical protein
MPRTLITGTVRSRCVHFGRRRKAGCTLVVTVFRALLALSVAGLLLTACGAASAPAGESQATAVSQAMPTAQGVSDTPVSLVSASSGPFAHVVATTGDTMSATRLVWAVVFHGTFNAPSCGPAGPGPHTCQSNTTMLVVLDYKTGAFLMGQTPAQVG